MPVWVLQGLPGSGKSSWVRKWRTFGGENPYKLVCSADDYFIGADGTYTFDASKLADAHGACLRQYTEALQSGRFAAIVVDNTNLSTAEVAPYMALASAYKMSAVILRFEVDLGVAASRNVHGVGLPTLASMQARLACFQAMPWWVIRQGNSSPDGGLFL